MKIKLDLFVNHTNKYLDVRVGFSDAVHDGSVTKTIRKDNVTVGLKDNGLPVYIRLKNVESLTGVFKTAYIFVESGRTPDLKTQGKIIKYALNKMRDMTLEYNTAKRRAELDALIEEPVGSPEFSMARV